jgi:hypothetical protein
LEAHLQIVCQIMEEEDCHYRSLIQKIKKRSKSLNRFSKGQSGKRQGIESKKGNHERRDGETFASVI